MKKTINQIDAYIRNFYNRIRIYRRDFWMIKKLDLPKLSKKEKEALKQTWPCFNFKFTDLIWSRLYKKENGFSPYFINDYQLRFILKKHNPYKQVVSLENKAMLDIYFSKLPTPKPYVKCINGVFFNEVSDVISKKEIVSLLKSIKSGVFFIKPTIETGTGIGVKKIDLSLIKNVDKYILSLLDNNGDNFIIQEVLEQNVKLSKMNPTSVNTCRITSLFINGKFSYSSIFKVGKMGSNVDNWHSSYFVGMSNNGVLYDYGYDSMLNRVYKTDTGIIFSGFKIPNFEKMVTFVEEHHLKYFPHCGIVGWDIMVDKNDKIRVIEVNIVTPGVIGEQLCSGTFFKDFRDDICTSKI